MRRWRANAFSNGVLSKWRSSGAIGVSKITTRAGSDLAESNHGRFLAEDGADGTPDLEGADVVPGAGGNSESRLIPESSEAYSKQTAICASLRPASAGEPLDTGMPARRNDSTEARSERRTRSRLRETLDSCSPRMRPISARVLSSR